MEKVGELGPYFKSAEILPFSDWMRFQLKILHHEGEDASDEV